MREAELGVTQKTRLSLGLEEEEQPKTKESACPENLCMKRLFEQNQFGEVCFTSYGGL